MAEIIKRGELPSEVTYHVVCGNCKTHFKYKGHELSHSNDQRDPGCYVKCPLCRSNVWMNTPTKYNG